MLSRIWTESAGRFAAAGVMLLLAACGGTRSNNISIKPISADVTFTHAPSGDHVVYLDKGTAIGDVVTLNLMLRSSTPITMDAFAFDVFFDPGIVNVSGPQSPVPLPTPTPFSDTFLGTCNATVTCPPAAAPVQNPICLLNSADANFTGDLALGVAVNAPSMTGCPAQTTTPGMDTRLVTLVFDAATTGSSRIQLPPISTSAARCAILLNGAAIAISCDDRGAVLTGSR